MEVGRMGVGLFEAFKLKSITKQLERKYGRLHIVALNNGDCLDMRNGKLTVRHGGAYRQYSGKDIWRISIFTNDRDIFASDMALAVFLADSVFLIHAEQELFHISLFEKLGKELDINFTQTARAMTCVENAEFVLYASAKAHSVLSPAEAANTIARL